MSPVNRWSVVHGELRSVAAKRLTGARPHGRFWAQKLVVAASNRSGGGGDPHQGLLRPAQWREETGGEEE
jgi:hypothetical protein